MVTAASAAQACETAGYDRIRAETLGQGGQRYDELVHRDSGARHVHITCQAPDSAFGVLVPTVVDDSTGVAHVLEHMIGCGSRRYNVHNAFYAMIDRSLATFLNGLTTPAWTAFVFCTPLPQDYRNLVDVLLDGVFYPRLSSLAFDREGHRLEFRQHNDPSTPLVRRGVVYNEMAPLLTQPRAAMELAIGRGLYPSLPYGHDAGGDLEALPLLNPTRVREFHHRYFHPAEAVFFSFGQIPLADVLRWVQPYLEGNGRRGPARSGMLQPPLGPCRLRASYASDGSGQAAPQALLAWAGPPWSKPFDVFCLKALRELHLGDSRSRLRLALRQAGFRGGLADGSGLHAQFYQPAFAVGAKGVKPEQAEVVERVILDALQDKPAGDEVAVALRRIRLREQESEVAAHGLPRAVRLLQEMANPLLYGGDVVAALDRSAHLRQLGSGEAAGEVLHHCARRWLLDNQHRLLVTLQPDPDLLAARAATEQQRMLDTGRVLNPAASNRLVQRAKELRSWQRDSHSGQLPLLRLHDLDALDGHIGQARMDDDLSVPTAVTQAPTGDLVCLDVLIDTTGMPLELRRHLPLWAWHLTRFGSDDEEVARNQDRIRWYTGGVDVAFGSHRAPDGADHTKSRLRWSVRFLAEDLDRTLQLLRDALRPGSRLRPEQQLQLLRQRQHILIARDRGRAARGLAAAKVSPAAATQDRFDGLAALQWSDHLLSLGEPGLAQLQPALAALDSELLRRARIAVSVTADAAVYRRIRPRLERHLSRCAWAEDPITVRADDDLLPGPSNGIDRRPGSMARAFNARAYPMPPLVHPDCAALAVLGEQLRSQYLWEIVRELGGAYGVGAVAEPELGVFQLWSERDPNIDTTFDAFDQAVHYVGERAPDDAALHAAKLAAVRRLHRWPSATVRLRESAWRSLDGYSEGRIALLQRQIIGVEFNDLARSAMQWLVPEAASDVSLDGAST
jgi:Zn-dependent M16 (insulinase) family peptidase